ncbi:hypothetical protein U1Q18_030093 [Sarracenia purpurea var. burkii]
MVAEVEIPQGSPLGSDHDICLEKTKTLICALNLLSRNLPLPQDVFDAVSSIYRGCDDEVDAPGAAVEETVDVGGSDLNAVEKASGGLGISEREDLMMDLEAALVEQRSNCMPGFGLTESRDIRLQSHIQHRLTELEELPSSRGEDLQSKCLLELYGLKLAELQHKVRSDVSSEYWLRVHCAYPSNQLFDWGMMRFLRPLNGVGDAFDVEADDNLKQKRDAEAWHGRQRQRATRAEKLRFQALKADDQETYMRMVEDSKNERLTLLLGKTNELLVRLGAAVQRQKYAEHDDIEPLKDSDADLPASKSETPGDALPEEAADTVNRESIHHVKTGDLLQGQRQYNSVIHSIQEKVNTEVLSTCLMLFVNAVGLSIVAVLYDGHLDKRKALREEYLAEGKFNVLITHYDLIMRDKSFLKKIHWYYMIVDEGHRLKNHECALSRTLVSGTYRIRRRLLLTGTPIQNSLQELWSLLNYLLPTIFNSVENFEEWFNAPFADPCDVSLTDEEELLIIRRLHHVIRPFILRRKKDEVEKYLPGKSQVILKCDMSAWQKLYYQQVTDVGRVGLNTGSGKSKSLQNLSMQLRKCCNHPYLFVGEYNMWHKVEIFRASGKFELLDRLLPKLHRAGHRVLLFSQMTRLMDILEIYLQLHDFQFLRLDGSTKTEERGILLNQFNAPDSPFFMFLLSTRAGGLGLNLQTADTVIIFDSDWNPQMDQQAEDRAHRIGQKKEVRIFVLVSVGSIEEVILERSKQKMGIDAKVIQAGLFNTTSTAQDRREMLKEIMHKGTSALGRDVPSEREINHLAARSNEEFWLFEKMDEERRRKEHYRARLMEEHEVPNWAHTAPDRNEGKTKGFEYESVTGKSRRKKVVYVDSLTDLQWMKAVEFEEDIASHSLRGKWGHHHLLATGNEKVLEVKGEDSSMASPTSEETASLKSKRLSSEVEYPEKIERQGFREDGGNEMTWKPHKRKRSRLIS